MLLILYNIYTFAFISNSINNMSTFYVRRAKGNYYPINPTTGVCYPYRCLRCGMHYLSLSGLLIKHGFHDHTNHLPQKLEGSCWVNIDTMPPHDELVSRAAKRARNEGPRNFEKSWNNAHPENQIHMLTSSQSESSYDAPDAAVVDDYSDEEAVTDDDAATDAELFLCSERNIDAPKNSQAVEQTKFIPAVTGPSSLTLNEVIFLFCFFLPFVLL